MPEQNANILAEPICEAITVVVSTRVGGDPGRVVRRRLATALRLTLGRPVTGWHVRRVRGSDQPEYDITPPDGEHLPVADAWDLTYMLAEQPEIVYAEPSFRVLQDAEAVPAETLPAAPAAQPAALPGFDSCADDTPPASVDPNQLDWAPRLVDLPCAWELEPPPPAPGFARGQRRGKGIRVGHPDSGYRRHPDLFEEPAGQPVRVLTALERDFVDKDSKAENPDGGHGLNTGGVLMSSDVTGFVVGAAPEAEIVPLRVTKPRFGLPAPVLFDSGARALRDAIRYAVNEADCHVISISLGWFGNWSLHQAIREAVDKNVIVIAASGNYVKLVVWPAAYPEVIAVAGCDAQRKPWWGACTGPQVAVTGPAARVWVSGFTAAGLPGAGQSDGTSFATAMLAGIAALWLAHHGRDYLLHRYAGHATLSAVFRHVVQTTCDDFAGDRPSGYGAGIYNARRILATPLPSVADLAFAGLAAPAAPRPVTPVDTIAAAFPTVPEDVLRRRLAALLQVEEAELDARLAGVEQELLFQIATNPALREQLGAPVVDVAAGGMIPAAAPAPEAQATLSAAPLSDTLRSRIK